MIFFDLQKKFINQTKIDTSENGKADLDTAMVCFSTQTVLNTKESGIKTISTALEFSLFTMVRNTQAVSTMIE